MPQPSARLRSALADVVTNRAQSAGDDGRGLYTRVGPVLIAALPRCVVLEDGRASEDSPSPLPAALHPSVLWRYYSDAERSSGGSGGIDSGDPAPPPAHLFSVAAAALHAGVRSGTPQALVFLGESGSGKGTCAAGAALYVATVARAAALRLTSRLDGLRAAAMDAALRAARAAPPSAWLVRGGEDSPLSREWLLAAAAHTAAVQGAATGVGGGAVMGAGMGIGRAHV